MPNIKSFDESAKNSNTSSVKIFENSEFGKIRTILRDGNPWFVGNDVATVLGYKIPKDAVRAHVPDKDKFLVQLSDIQEGGDSPLSDNIKGSKIIIINEAGLYRLFLRSNMPNAEKFTDWVTSEVIPSIRKTGEYKLYKTSFKEPSNSVEYVDTVNAAMRALKENMRLSDASLVSYFNKSVSVIGLPEVDYVPSKGVKFSATFLLNKFGRKESIHDFNQKMEEKGFLETRTRPSSKGVKRFKSLTEKGLEFGENMVSPKNEKETQPHYYEGKFETLIAILFS